MESVFEILSYVFWVILAITILVFVHEMGHFLFAKLFGMRVDRFSVGFPPKIFGKTVGETEYVVGATPLGGYVKIAGMIDESMDTDYLESEPEPWEFRSKPVWQRMVVISAGVIFNVILAFFIFTGLKLAYGETYIPAENVDAVHVADSSIAYDMGLRTGDRILAVSGNVFEEYEDLASIESLIADPFTITTVRDGDTLVMEGPSDIFTQLNRRSGLGISIDPAIISGIIAGTPADSIGLRGGDRIVSVNGEEIRYWAAMNGVIQASGGGPLRIRWLRPDSLAEGGDVPAFVQAVDETSIGTIYEASVRPTQRDGNYLLGVYAPTSQVVAQEFGELRRGFTVFGALGVGLADTWTNTKGIAVSLGRVFTGQENFRENVGGPIMIAQITKQAADAGALYFWNIVAMLSITLAIINILPIPVLDGGHLVFLLYEGIVRREPSLRFRMITQQIGMILLLVFMTFLIFNDILRL